MPEQEWVILKTFERKSIQYHVLPVFGREHTLFSPCWCDPVIAYIDRKNQNVVLQHRASQ